MKKVWMVFLSLCLTAGLLAGCSGGGSSDTSGASGESSNGGGASGTSQLNVVTEMMSPTLEPATNWDSWFVVRWGAGETLVRYAEDGSIEPWLAEKWEVAEDNLTWTFHLRDGVKFSNGKDMTATDVVKSLERLYDLEDPANGGAGNPQGYFTWTELTADDEAGTVTIVTTEPTPDMAGCMAYPWNMIIDVDASAERDVTTEGPICTGPYAFASFTQDSDIQMARNEHYWDGEVPFETVNIMKAEEPTTRAMALQDGSAHMALNLSASDRDALEKAGGYNVDEIAGARTGYAHVNTQGVLGNDALRQAVMMAIDGETIADVTTSGAYTYGPAVVPSSLDYGYDSLTYEFAYDPEKAEKLLDDAGIVDSDGDGYRELDGEMIDIDYKVTTNRQMDTIAQAQATQLETIGIKCTVQLTETQADVLNNHLFDLCSSNEVVTSTGDPAIFLKHWHSTSVDNYSNYSNPEYDAAFEALSVEFDPENRREYVTQLQQILLDDAAVLVYGYFNYNICSVDSIEGIITTPNDFYWVTKDITVAG